MLKSKENIKTVTKQVTLEEDDYFDSVCLSAYLLKPAGESGR